MNKSVTPAALRPFRSYRLRYAGGILATCLSTWAGLSIPWIIRGVIDDLAAGRRSSVIPLIILAGLLRSAGMRFKRFGILGASVRLEEDCRNSIHDRVLAAHPRAFAGYRTGDLASRLTRDLEAVSAFRGQGVYDLVSTGIRMVSALALMLVIDPLLTAAALVPLLMLAGATKHFSRFFHERFRAVQEGAGDLTGGIHEAVKSIRRIKAEQLESFAAADFEKAADRYAEKQIELAGLQSLLLPTVVAMVGIAGVLMLLAGGASAGAGRISLGDFTAFYAYLSMLLWPVISLGLAFTARERSAAASSRIGEILEKAGDDESVPAHDPETAPARRRGPDPAQSREPSPDHHPEVSPGHHPEAAPPMPGEEPAENDGEDAPPLLECDFVHYTYPGSEKPALRGVTIRLEPGEKVLLTGTTASGKSTLLSVLAGTLEPDTGRVTTTGGPGADRDPDAISPVGLLTGSPYIFSGAMEWNITAGREGRRPIGRLLELAGLERDTERHADGVAREVGVRGGLLSGGQRQRLGLARFLSFDFRVWLLDDPFSHLDSATEAALMERLWKLAGDGTILLSSPSRAAALLADRVLVLHGGRIVEEGTHRSLLENRGLYSALMELGG